MAKSFEKNPAKQNDNGTNIKGIIRNQRLAATSSDNSNRFATRAPKLAKHKQVKYKSWKTGDYGHDD